MKKQEKARDRSIDFLRGVAVVLMVFVHVTAYFLNNPVTRLLWDYAHFIVPLFAFCSSYLFFLKADAYILDFRYVVSRAKRLILPWYVYVFFLFLFITLHPGLSVEWESVLEHVLFIDGRRFDWLVVLFLWFMLLFPLLWKLYRLRSVLFYVAFMASAASTVYLLIWNIDLPLRLSMWLPWLLIPFFGYCAVIMREKRWFLPVSFFYALGLFILSRYALHIQDKSFIFTDNKYPPNLYYLSYGIAWITVLLFLYKRVEKLVWLQDMLQYLSAKAYSLYFIHFFFVYALRKTVDYKIYGWIGFFVAVSVLSLATQWVWDKCFMLVRKNFLIDK